MALILTAWQADNNGQSEIKHLRSDHPKYKDIRIDWINEQKSNRACVLITMERTDNQSSKEEIIWQKPGYVDPCSR